MHGQMQWQQSTGLLEHRIHHCRFQYPSWQQRQPWTLCQAIWKMASLATQWAVNDEGGDGWERQYVISALVKLRLMNVGLCEGTEEINSIKLCKWWVICEEWNSTNLDKLQHQVGRSHKTSTTSPTWKSLLAKCCEPNIRLTQWLHQLNRGIHPNFPRPIVEREFQGISSTWSTSHHFQKDRDWETMEVWLELVRWQNDDLLSCFWQPPKFAVG